MARVTLRDLKTIDLTSQQKMISLLHFDYGELCDAPKRRKVSVGGISHSIALINIVLTSSAGSVNGQTSPSAGGYFEVVLDVPVTSPSDYLLIEATEVSTNGSTAAAFDRCASHLGNVYATATTPPEVANFDKGRMDYLAGLPDRFIASRTFVRLNFPARFDLKDVVAYIPNQKKEFSRLHTPDVAMLSKLADQVNEGSLNISTYYARAGEALSEALNAKLKPLSKSQSADLMKGIQSGKPKKAARNARGPYDGKNTQRVSLARQPGADRSGILLGQDLGNLNDLAGYWMNAVRGSQRIGMIFHDRLRISPMGTVVGEPLYRLALSPGEEVQLRQSSETRKRVNLEEIRDREEEQSLTLSSTLSTDLTATVSDTRSFQSQASLGGGLSGTIPKTPIGVSIDAGTSASSAHANSISETATFHNETSSNSMAKLRAQHKTTLEITNEQTTGYTTTRTLRNSNMQRSQIHSFFKLYRKERITLERHDAQLCLRLEVRDPALETRAAFLSAFHRLDPSNKSNWELPQAGSVTLVKSIVVNQPADQEAWAPIGGRHDRWVTLQIPDIGAKLSAPAGYVLADVPELRMTSVSVFSDGSGLAGADGTHVHSSELTRNSDVAANVLVQPVFQSSGGQVRKKSWPEPGQSPASLALDINFRFNMDGRPPVAPFVQNSMAITSVTFDLIATFAPGAALDQQWRDDMLERKRRFEQSFDPMAIYALASAARTDYPSSVLDQAIRQNFSSFSLDKMITLSRVFDLENAIVENVPYWASREASDTHFEMKWMLERLPLRVDSGAILTPELTGALAILYLPIRQGMERLALGLLGDLSKAEVDRLVGDLEQLRSSKFGLLRNAAVLDSSAIGQPSQMLATPAGASQWSHNWEKPMRRFEVLAEWSDLTPTDGLHMETQLSVTTVTDENSVAHLEKL